MRFKKGLFLLAMMAMFLFSACVNENEEKDSAIGVTLYRKGDVVKVISESDVAGTEILVGKSVSEESISIKSNFAFTKKTDTGLLVVLGESVKQGDELFVINGADKAVDVKLNQSVTYESISAGVKRNTAGNEKLLGDFNGDNEVDLLDFNSFINNYGSGDAKYDIAPASKGTGVWEDIFCFTEKDGIINIKDMVVLVRNFGKKVPGKEITNVEINSTMEINLEVGESVDLDATVSYSDGSQDNIVTWSVDKEGIVDYSVADYVVNVKGIVGDNLVSLKASAGDFSDTVLISIEKEKVKEEIGIYIHKDFATGIYGWVDANPIFGAWPGKSDLQEYAENPNYYEVIVSEYDTIEYLLVSGENKVTAEDQIAKIGYITWEADGSKVSGKPLVDNELKIEVSPIKSRYNEKDEVTINVSGGTIVSKEATLGGENISFIGNTAKFVVGNYLDDKAIKKLVVTGENQETGSKTADFDIYREDISVELVDDIDNLRIYQVMVCSFMDGDPSIGYDWQWAPYRANGDLQGIIDSLDYIESMNFNAIWMTPIFTTYNGQQAHNGYFANDYFNVDPNFGTNEKFRELVDKAHARGIYVLLDGVLGHNAGGNIAPSPLSGSVPTTSNPVNYQDGGATLQYYKDVVYYWIREYKIDGWRFDQSYQLGPGDGGDHKGQGGSNFYWDDIREEIERAVEENKMDGNKWGVLGYTVGEDWEGESGITQNTYGTDEEGLHSAFDFPTRYRLVQTLAREEHGKEVNEASNLDYSHDAYPDWAHPNLMLGNHDLARFGDLIDNSRSNNNNYWKRHKAALAFMGAYSGPITVYYGEEWGSKTGNEDLKTMHVSRNDGKISGFSSEEEDLRQYAAKIMDIRAQHSALWQENTRENLVASGNEYIDLKYDAATGEKIVFCLNVGTNSETFNVTVGSNYTDLITGETFNSSSIPMEGLQARYLLVK